VPCTILELAKFFQPYQLAFQETYRVPTILNNFDIALLTLPVTSASSLRCSAFYGADMDLMSLQ